MNEKIDYKEQFEIKVFEVDYLTRELAASIKREAQLNAFLTMQERELQALKSQETSAE